MRNIQLRFPIYVLFQATMRRKHRKLNLPSFCAQWTSMTIKNCTDNGKILMRYRQGNYTIRRQLIEFYLISLHAPGLVSWNSTKNAFIRIMVKIDSFPGECRNWSRDVNSPAALHLPRWIEFARSTWKMRCRPVPVENRRSGNGCTSYRWN